MKINTVGNYALTNNGIIHKPSNAPEKTGNNQPPANGSAENEERRTRLTEALDGAWTKWSGNLTSIQDKLFSNDISLAEYDRLIKENGQTLKDDLNRIRTDHGKSYDINGRGDQNGEPTGQLLNLVG